MFEPLGNLFSTGSGAWSEDDIRYGIQDYLRNILKTDQILCLSVRQGVIEVRVGSPTLYQEVKLLEYDLVQYTKSRFTYEVKRLRIIR